jgi:hypothetical protein
MAWVSEGLKPRPKEFAVVLFGNQENIIGLMAAKALDEREFERVEPEFRCAIVTLNMDMRRLEPVGHVEEEPEAAFA